MGFAEAIRKLGKGKKGGAALSLESPLKAQASAGKSRGGGGDAPVTRQPHPAKGNCHPVLTAC